MKNRVKVRVYEDTTSVVGGSYLTVSMPSIQLGGIKFLPDKDNIKILDSDYIKMKIYGSHISLSQIKEEVLSKYPKFLHEFIDIEI